MVDYRLKELRGGQRRRFLKIMGATAAAIGLERSGLLNFLADSGGHGLAEAATSSGRRCLTVTGGNGVFAWFQELWPLPEIAIQSVNTSFGNTSSYLYTTGHGFVDPYKGTDYTSSTSGKKFFYGPDAPWFDHQAGEPDPGKAMTAMIAGNDETHTEFPDSAAIVSGSSSLAATIGSIQAKATSALVPVIGIDPLKYGNAQGAPDVVTAPTAEGIIDLFNSAASQLVLKEPEDQQLFESYYNAMVGLRRASGRSSWQPQLAITKNAARIIGLSFGSQLTPTVTDLASFGISELLLETSTELSNAQKTGLSNFGRTLIVVAKAFKLGLSNSAIVGLSPGPTSETSFTDPHISFDGAAEMNRARNVTRYLGRILDAFYADLATADDPEAPGTKLDENTVFVAYGDTPHTPIQGNTWPDATPQDSNWLYVMGQGHLKDGWFGGMDENGNVSGWKPETGEDMPGQPATQTSTAAGAAAAYAVAKGDMNTVAQYYVGPPITGVIK
jgi:hypothetical protein